MSTRVAAGFGPRQSERPLWRADLARAHDSKFGGVKEKFLAFSTIPWSHGSVASHPVQLIRFLVLFAAITASGSGSVIAAVAESPAPAATVAPEEAAKKVQPADGVASSKETPSSAVESSVVKIFCIARYPALYKPWTKQAPSEVTGSGVVITGNRILTTAHVVLYASDIQMQANQGGDKLSASVEFMDPGIDLAVLKLDDESFFASHRALPFAKAIPDVQNVVSIYGYPTGGSSLSVAKGIISRIEFAGYSYAVAGLRIQLDAAINAGNSGGPAVVSDKMIGVVFSRLDESQNIGYIVPLEEIELFLRDIADGHFDGKPALYDNLQTLDNPALRSFLRLGKSVQGIVVHKPYSNDPDYPLKEWDLITRIGDSPVDNQGMITLKDKHDLRVRFAYLVQKIARDGKVSMTIVRAGKEMRVQVPTAQGRARLIPDLRGGHPSYFIYGPLAFSEATSQLLGDYGEGNKAADWMLDLSYAGSPLLARAGDKPDFPGHRLVFVSAPFFPHRLAKGYSNPSQQVVKTINGKLIKNLAHLVETLRDCTDESVVIEFAMLGGETLVFPRAEMIAATEEVLTDNGVRSQGSPDMLAVWNMKSAPHAAADRH